jgi:hypothetical protein
VRKYEGQGCVACSSCKDKASKPHFGPILKRVELNYVFRRASLIFADLGRLWLNRLGYLGQQFESGLSPYSSHIQNFVGHIVQIGLPSFNFFIRHNCFTYIKKCYIGTWHFCVWLNSSLFNDFFLYSINCFGAIDLLLSILTVLI